MPRLRLMLPAALLAVLATPAAHALEVRDARTPEPPPGAPVLAGYMALHNGGDDAVVVTGASSAAFEHVELHDTEVEDGQATMFEVEQIEVPPGGAVELAPRGKHVMLYTPAEDVEQGDTLPLTLETAAGDSIAVELEVVDRDTLEHNGDMDHDH